MSELQRVPNSSLPFAEVGSVQSYTSSKWKTIIDLQVDPGFAYHVFDIYVIVQSVATPEGFIRITSNGVPLVREYASAIDAVFLYFNGKLVFRGKQQKSPLVIEVRSDGSTSMDAEGWVSGIKVPIQEQSEEIEAKKKS